MRQRSTQGQKAGSEPAAPDAPEKTKPSHGSGGSSYLRVFGVIVLLGAAGAGWAYYRWKYAPTQPYVPDEYGTDVELFTAEALSAAKDRFLQAPDKHPILLTIAGHVFDVTNGRTFYGPGGGYEFFSFRDASRAFTTGNFKEDGLTDDLSGLEEDSCRGVYRWLTFFKDKHPKYVFKGRLVGRHFDRKGRPTEEFKAFLECAGANRQETPDEAAERARKNFPFGLEQCSKRWARDEGHMVWCTGEDEHGQRKVPRRLVPISEAVDPSAPLTGPGRCLCVDPTDEVTPDNHRLVQYPGCGEEDDSCHFK